MEYEEKKLVLADYSDYGLRITRKNDQNDHWNSRDLMD